eukprot:1426317-Rhodomonas_salina.1
MMRGHGVDLACSMLQHVQRMLPVSRRSRRSSMRPAGAESVGSEGHFGSLWERLVQVHAGSAGACAP